MFISSGYIMLFDSIIYQDDLRSLALSSLGHVQVMLKNKIQYGDNTKA